MVRCYSLCCGLLLLVCCCGIPGLGVAQSRGKQALLQRPALSSATTGLVVMDAKTGERLEEHRADKSLSPASVLKVVTTSTALSILGKEYRFKTELQYDGRITSEGVLEGNLYIKGYGDPSLGDDRIGGNPGTAELMRSFVAAVQKMGIRSVRGQVIGDGSYFAQQSTPASWQWNDLGNYYGAGVSGLNIGANTCVLRFQQKAAAGQRPDFLGASPKLHNVRFVNQVLTGPKGSGDQCYVYGAPLQNLRFLRGTIPPGGGTFEVKGSLPEPAFTAAALLLEALEAAGVETSLRASTHFLETLEGKAPGAERKTFHTHQSPSLWELCRLANGKSINLYCEAMLRAIGVRQKGEGSWEKGVEAVREFWKNKGVEVDGFFMEDGSGLSVRNAVSPNQIADILRLADSSLGIGFADNLPVGGKTGTLRWMFKGTAAEGRIYAKTGSMDRIRCYAGYIQARSGRRLTFCVLVNHFHSPSAAVRKALEEWMLDCYRRY